MWALKQTFGRGQDYKTWNASALELAEDRLQARVGCRVYHHNRREKQ